MTIRKIGLVVITLERYFKTVHAVAHRKQCRDSMTVVGVAVPWIVGFFTFVIPAIIWKTTLATTLPEHCDGLGFWTSDGGRKVRQVSFISQRTKFDKKHTVISSGNVEGGKTRYIVIQS